MLAQLPRLSCYEWKSREGFSFYNFFCIFRPLSINWCPKRIFSELWWCSCNVWGWFVVHNQCYSLSFKHKIVFASFPFRWLFKLSPPSSLIKLLKLFSWCWDLISFSQRPSCTPLMNFLWLKLDRLATSSLCLVGGWLFHCL